MSMRSTLRPFYPPGLTYSPSFLTPNGLHMSRHFTRIPSTSSHILVRNFLSKTGPHTQIQETGPYLRKSFNFQCNFPLQKKELETDDMKLTILLGVAAISVGLFLFKNSSTEVSTPRTTTPVSFSTLTNRKWVEKCVDQYPEILWLADTDVRKTEEGHASLQGSYSEQLFKNKFLEFDRTIMTLHCLKLILNGGNEAYEAFTSGQSSEIRLTKESFQALHIQLQGLLKSQWGGLSEKEMVEALETALVLGDMGKSEKAREVFKSYGIDAPDHDDFHGEVMHFLEKHPEKHLELCPSFAKLSPAGKQLLIKVANLAHYGHITHIEGGMNMFSTLKESGLPSSDPTALLFDLLVHTCDVAGALGHVNNSSSLVYTEPSHQAMQAIGKATRILSDPLKTEQDAYDSYLIDRATWLGLNPHDPMDRILTRIGAMLRFFNAEEGAILRKAVAQLDENVRAKIIAQLALQEGRTPTYMPAVLVNLSNNPQLGAKREERLEQAVAIGLPFIADVLERHREMLQQGQVDPSNPLNFNHAAFNAKQFPNKLVNKEFMIDHESLVRDPLS